MKECVIISHLGLGDLILISGLAVHLAERYDVVRFPCRTQDQNSIMSFFFLQPKIKIYSFNADSTTPQNFPLYHATSKADKIWLGFYNLDHPMDRSISFAENFYRQAEVDYSVRWDKCPIQEVVDKFYNVNTVAPHSDFMHDDPGRGFVIKNLSFNNADVRVREHNPASILAYSGPLKYCANVRVIDGPFLHLAESIETTGKLYYHKYARPLSARWSNLDCPTRKKWTVLE